jgi:hypothetical protein
VSEDGHKYFFGGWPEMPWKRKTMSEQDIRIMTANIEYLQNAKDEIFELFCDVRDKFDGSEYQQGKKDGLRLALALLGMPEMTAFNRGNAGARE